MIMKLGKLTWVALISATLLAPVFAQPGPGMGPGGGMRPGGGMGGMGAGGGMGRQFSLNQDNTVGWALMTPQERTEHRTKMWSFKSYEECTAYQQQHHDTMMARAKEQGKTIAQPRANACERMQARGLFK
jgi:hypothetical protein